MKDFYDLYVLLRLNQFDQNIILESIKATFSRRDSIISKTASFFEGEFKTNPKLNSLWNLFIKNNNLTIGST